MYFLKQNTIINLIKVVERTTESWSLHKLAIKIWHILKLESL